MLEHPHIVIMAAVLAVLISLPMLSNGLFLDDYAQRIKLMTGDTNIFDNFAYGERLIPSGELPWWLHPEARVRFFRPLAAWLTRLDYALFPNAIGLMHLHSVLWYGALVAVAGVVYRTFIPALWAAGLAVVLFAVDAHHAGAVQWLCNRNVLLSLMCGLLSLYCHHKPFIGHRWLAALLYATGLLAGESALAISGYLLGYELFLSSGSWGRRFLHLLPYGLIGIIYLVLWRHAGYGAFGPGFYVDPWHDPGLFLQEMLFRAPAYLASQYFPPPAEVLGFLETPPAREWMLFPTMVYVWIVTGLLGWFFWPLLRQSAVAQFFATGILVALLPLSGITLASRELWYVGFGATGLLALYVQAWRNNEFDVRVRSDRHGRMFLGSMLVLHLWLSPVFYVLASKVPEFLDRQWDSRVVNLPNATGQDRHVLLLSCNQYVTDVAYPLLTDKAYSLGDKPTRPMPSISKIFAMAEGLTPYSLTRWDADTLILQTAQAQSLETLRPLHYGFTPGNIIHHEGIAIEILAVTETGNPTKIRFQFKPGELDRYEVMEWQGKQFVATTLPAIGQSREVTPSVP